MVGLPVSTWATALLVFFAVGLGTISVALMVEWVQERRQQREALKQLRAFTNDDPEAGGILSAGQDLPHWFRPIAARIPAFQDLDLMMERAGMKGHLPLFLMSTLGLTVGLGVATLGLTRLWPAAVLAAGAGAILPYVVVRRRQNKRLYAFEEMLPEAIDLLSRAIRAGHPLTAGLKMVADETKEPISGEFRRTHEENRFGLPFEDALLAMADRVSIIDVRILTTAILIQREVGGNLAEVLDNLANVIRVRFTIRRQLRVYTAQGRFSGYVLAALPIAVGAAIYSLNPSYITLLFTDPLGKLLVLMAVVFQIIGFLWIRKIVNIEI
ncbi:MAG: type II secretion system F family protein [Gemmatimonadales bacterium]